MSEIKSTPNLLKNRAATPGGARVAIYVGDGELHRWTDETWAALMADNARDPRHPKILVHGSDLVRLSGGKLEEHKAASLKEQISRVVMFTRGADDDGDPKPTTVPHDVALALLARTGDEYGPDAPLVEVITDVPLLMADGTILSEPGYSVQHRTYYQPADDLKDLKIPGPGEVGPDELRDAVNFLMDDWFGEFGFKEEACRANAVATMTTIFVRDFISGGVPLMPIRADEAGWGKSALTDACFMPGCGVIPKAVNAGSEEEMEKRITAKLRKAPTGISLDNVTGHFDSAALASVLTTGIYEGRILGTSDIFTVEPRCVWTINGNGFTMSSELMDRSPAPITLGRGDYWERLCETKGWNPEIKPRLQPKSNYSHREYETFQAWLKANRARAVEAAFVLIRHWLDGPGELYEHGSQGERFYRPMLNDEPFEPLRPENDSGEFPEWRRVVGGILRAAGIKGLGENFATWSNQTDMETEEKINYLAAWRGLNRDSLTIKELDPLGSFDQPLHDVLPRKVVEGHPDGRAKRLEVFIRNLGEESFGGYRVVRHPGRPNRYEVMGTGRG
jgi:hypothetical protein